MFGFDPKVFWGAVALACLLLGLLILWVRARVRRNRIRRNIQQGIQRGVVGNPSILPRQRKGDHDKLN